MNETCLEGNLETSTNISRAHTCICIFRHVYKGLCWGFSHIIKLLDVHKYPPCRTGSMNEGISHLEYYKATREDGVALRMTKWKGPQDMVPCENAFWKEEMPTCEGPGISGASPPAGSTGWSAETSVCSRRHAFVFSLPWCLRPFNQVLVSLTHF